MTVAVGDVVMLRSGGFKMTVCKVNDEQSVLCCWFVDNQLQREIFPATALVVVRVDSRVDSRVNSRVLLKQGYSIRLKDWRGTLAFVKLVDGQAKLFSRPDDQCPVIVSNNEGLNLGAWEIVGDSLEEQGFPSR